MFGLLSRLEGSPTASFPERILVRQFREDFEALRSLGLLRQEDLPTGAFLLDRDGTSYVVKLDGNRYIGIESDETEPEIIEFDEAEVRRWSVDLVALAGRVNQINQLAGRPERVGERLWFLGERHEGEALLLGFYSDTSTLEDQLLTLRARFPATYSSFKVFCPTFDAPPSVLAHLESKGIQVLELDVASPLELPLLEMQRSGQPVFSHSPDYRSVNLRGKNFLLTPQRAKVVRILDRARCNGHGQLPWADIETQLRAGPDPFYAKRMQDAFKDMDNWRELIKRTSHGYYALNL